MVGCSPLTVRALGTLSTLSQGACASQVPAWARDKLEKVVLATLTWLEEATSSPQVAIDKFKVPAMPKTAILHTQVRRCGGRWGGGAPMT